MGEKKSKIFRIQKIFNTFENLINTICQNRTLLFAEDEESVYFQKDENNSCNGENKSGNIVSKNDTSKVVGRWEKVTKGEEKFLLINAPFNNKDNAFYTLYDHDNNENTEKVVFQGYLDKKDDKYIRIGYNNIASEAIKESIKNNEIK